jgi:hypothetical protein
VNDIDIHQLNLGPFKILERMVENPLKNVFFLHLFINKCIICFLFKKKPLSYEKGGDFVGGLCIIIIIFFYLVMFHESQT